MRLDQEARPGTPATAVGCEPIELDGGRHVIETSPDVRFEWLTLASARPSGDDAGSIRPSETDAVPADESSSTSLDAPLRAPADSTLVVGRSYDPQWSASLDGESLGDPVALDTQNGWKLGDRASDGSLHVELGAQNVYVVSLIVTALGVAACVVLLVWPRRRRRETISTVEER
jgi:hypothetical protein